MSAMRRPRAIGRACVIAATLIVFVCVANAQSHHRGTLSIQAIQTSYPVGSDVQIVVALTNISDHSVTFRNLRWVPAEVYEIRDEEGHLAPETAQLVNLKKEFYQNGEWRGHRRGSAWIGPFPDDETVVRPGKLVSFGAMVNRYYDMSRPGKYSIIAKRRSDEPPYEWISSNEIQVIITPEEN